jgi:hypothetical protein
MCSDLRLLTSGGVAEVNPINGMAAKLAANFSHCLGDAVFGPLA